MRWLADVGLGRDGIRPSYGPGQKAGVLPPPGRDLRRARHFQAGLPAGRMAVGQQRVPRGCRHRCAHRRHNGVLGLGVVRQPMKGLRVVVSFCVLLKARPRQWDTMFTQTHRGAAHAARSRRARVGCRHVWGMPPGFVGSAGGQSPLGTLHILQAARNSPNRPQDPETPGNPRNQAQGAHRMATALYSVTWFEPPPSGPPGTTPPGPNPVYRQEAAPKPYPRRPDTHRGQSLRDTVGPCTRSRTRSYLAGQPGKGLSEP